MTKTNNNAITQPWPGRGSVAARQMAKRDEHVESCSHEPKAKTTGTVGGFCRLNTTVDIQVRVFETTPHNDPTHGTWEKMVDVAEYPASWGKGRAAAIRRWLAGRGATLCAVCDDNFDGVLPANVRV